MIGAVISLFLYGALPAYLIGSIPFGIIVAKLFRLGNLREIGSGNIGATNVVRAGGKKFGALVLLLDALKGGIGGSIAFFAVAVIGFIMHDYPSSHPGTARHTISILVQTIAVYGTFLSVFLGHMFPVWIKFQGGKGISIMIGTLAAISIVNHNPFLILIYLGLWVAIYKMTRTSSLAGMGASVGIVLFFGYSLLRHPHDISFQNLFFTYLIATILVLYRHKENIRRLLRGEEFRFKGFPKEILIEGEEQT